MVRDAGLSKNRKAEENSKNKKMSRSISALYRSALPKPKKIATCTQLLELDELGFKGDASCMAIADADVHILQLEEMRSRRMRQETLTKLAEDKVRV